jgi:hypothetical protein
LYKGLDEPCTMGNWSFMGVKRPGRGSDHHPHSITDVYVWVDLPSVAPCNVTG